MAAVNLYVYNSSDLFFSYRSFFYFFIYFDKKKLWVLNLRELCKVIVSGLRYMNKRLPITYIDAHIFYLYYGPCGCVSKLYTLWYPENIDI